MYTDNKALETETLSFLEFTETSKTGKLPERKPEQTEAQYKALVCANALSDWAMCSFKNPPENFGTGMVEAGILLDITPMPDNFRAWAKKHLNKCD